MLSAEQRAWLSKHRLSVMIIGAFLAIVIIVLLSPTFQECIGANQEVNQASGFQYPITIFGHVWWCGGIFARENGEAITALATAAMAAFTGTLWWATTEQGRLTQKSIDEAKLSNERQLRAYVAPIPKFVFCFDASTTPKISFDLKNSGVTPALGLQHRTGIGLLRFPYNGGDSLPPLDDQTFSAPMVLHPSTDFQGYAGRTQAFTAQEIADIVKGAARIMVYGELFYLDIFGKRSDVVFCQAVLADSKTFAKLTAGYRKDDLKVTFEIAPMGNHAKYP